MTRNTCVRICDTEKDANRIEDRAKQFDPDAYGVFDVSNNRYLIYAELSFKEAKRLGFRPSGNREYKC